MKPVEDPPVKDQAAEISRLKGVIAKCQSALAQCKQWKEGVNTLTTHNHEAVQEALAVIQGIDHLHVENKSLKVELHDADEALKAVEKALADVDYRGTYADGVLYLKSQLAETRLNR